MKDTPPPHLFFFLAIQSMIHATVVLSTRVGCGVACPPACQWAAFAFLIVASRDLKVKAIIDKMRWRKPRLAQVRRPWRLTLSLAIGIAGRARFPFHFFFLGQELSSTFSDPDLLYRGLRCKDEASSSGGVLWHHAGGVSESTSAFSERTPSPCVRFPFRSISWAMVPRQLQTFLYFSHIISACEYHLMLLGVNTIFYEWLLMGKWPIYMC